MYNFIDVNEVSDGVVLPSEALMINGEYIENQIAGYRTLTVQGREALSPDVVGYTTGVRDGSRIKSKRFPERIITVTYQLIAESNEAFREAYNNLAAILNVKDAELIFNDEQDKFFVGTPCVIDTVKPGTNSVVGNFEILCADPFKYSVIEYEAQSDLAENGFLIDYKGTYKAFPTLEAEFFNENESDGTLTGSGDCGYVAFFNEDQKIIQLGDPDEADTETYPKSQTLVMQQFDSEAAWGSVAQANWATNSSPLINSREEHQMGNVKMAVCGYQSAYEPELSGTLLSVKNTTAKPSVAYKVTAKAFGREEDRINVRVTIETTMPDAKKVTSYTNKVSAGAKITLKPGTQGYVSSTIGTSFGAVSGTFYLWDSSVKNGRIRITNAANRVGKSGQVTCWVKLSDTGLSTSGTKVTSITGVVTSGYGLKAGIQIGSSGWKYVTLKDEWGSWIPNGTYTKTLDVTVKDLAADTTEIEDIKFKVERTDDIEDNVGIIEETECATLEINTYEAPVANEWYLAPETFGTQEEWHGPAITRKIPADAAGDVGAANFTFSYKHKIGIGTRSYSNQEYGDFMVLLVSGSGEARKCLACIDVYKEESGTNGDVYFEANGKRVGLFHIDLSNNKATAKTCTITKSGATVTFDAYGQKMTYVDASIKDVAVTEITFFFGQFYNVPALYYNGIYWAKFIKNNCDTWNDIPNKFSANDVLTIDCQSGEILLNGIPTPALGALGNDWEGFYLTPGLNQIGYSYSDWVAAEYAPKCRVRYREVFL